MYNDGQKQIDSSLCAMPDDVWKKFHNILRIQSSSKNEVPMILHLYDILKGKYHIEADNVGNIIVTKGISDNFPCIVAHLDTVHAFHKNYKVVYIKKGNTIHAKAENNGLSVGVGGDDKCGIFACLYLLEKLDNLKVVFFTQEESGLIGSSDIELDYFKDVGYVIQLDRWGRGDFICKHYSGNTASVDYMEIAKPILSKYGYHPEIGLITDSINLWDRELGVSCVNVSCGYYQHHSNLEFVDLNEFYNSLKFTEELMINLGEKRYDSIPMVYSKYYKDDYDDDYWGTPYKKKYDEAWRFDANSNSWVSKAVKSDLQMANTVKDDDARQDDVFDNYDLIKTTIKEEIISNNIDINNVSYYECGFLMDQLGMCGFDLIRDEMMEFIDELKYEQAMEEYEKEVENDYKK